MSNTIQNHSESQKRRVPKMAYSALRKARQPKSIFRRINETIFMLLDYDPTNVNSGEADSPNLISAITQWLYRVIWTRKIELGGFVVVVVVGMVCYSAVVDSNHRPGRKIDRPIMSSSDLHAESYPTNDTQIANIQR